MLSEEVNERILHNMPLVSTEGACKFCGQLAAIQVPGDWTDEEKNEYATEMCMCPEADWYRLNKLKKKKDGRESDHYLNGISLMLSKASCRQQWN